MITKELVEYGLGDKEARAYLALLELEIASVQEIAKAAGINRSSMYVTIESLKKRGLVSVSDDKSVRRYIAAPPEALLRSAEDKAVRQEHIRKKIEAVIPDMKALYKGTKKKPIVRIFEGREGLVSAFEDTLTNKEKVMRVSSSMENLIKLLPPNYLPEYIKRRHKLGIKKFGIHSFNNIFRGLAATVTSNLDIHIPIPAKKYKSSADIAIYANKIGYMSAENGGTAIIIESKEISDVMKNIFDLALEEARRLSREIKEG